MNKTALITGASGGLGYEFAQIFAREGFDLVLVARNEKNLLVIKREIEDKYRVSVTVIAQDLAMKDATLDILDKVLEKKLQIDVLVNNAGFGDFGRFATCDWDKQYEMIQVNLTAMMQMTQCFMNPMIQAGYGRILNLASTAAFQPGPLMSNYYAGKSFVLSFTEAISIELNGTGVTAMALCPGPTKTGFEDRAELGNSKLFTTLKVANSKKVAEFGYRKLMKGKTVAVHGLQNKLLVIGTKIASRSLIRNVMYHIQKESNG